MAGEQRNLPGVKPKRVQAVEDAFDKYLDAKAARAKATEKLDDAKDELYRMMQNHNQPVYGKKYKSKMYTATISAEETVKVKRQVSDREK